MEDKGKAINLETDAEEEDLQAFVEEIEVDEEMEEDIQPVCDVAKMPKDLDATKSALQSPLLLDGILFEGSILGCMPSMKFEY